MEITEAPDDLEDTKAALGKDEKLLLEREKGCRKKIQEWEEVKKTNAEELAALADTSKVVNDDEALELFCTGGEGSFCLSACQVPFLGRGWE